MYSVIGSDGQIYGPVDIPTLEKWCRDGRITLRTNIIDPISGRTFRAEEMLELRSLLTEPPKIVPPKTGQVMPPHPPILPQDIQDPFIKPAAHTYNPNQHQGFLAQPPPAPYTQINNYQYISSPPKSKIAAGLLAMFLGTLGFHRFYLGYSGVGAFMLLFTLCTGGWGSIITFPWALIECILCFTGGMRDAQNRPLVD